jgi:hypothetical protein
MSNVLNNGSVCALYLALEIILIAVFCFLKRSFRMYLGAQDHT